jgi:hypothetical protein
MKHPDSGTTSHPPFHATSLRVAGEATGAMAHFNQDFAGIFLDQWGCEAERLGWRADELFGLDPLAPMGRYDRMGLIWMLCGQTVIHISGTAARLSGGLTFYRKAAA